MNNRLKFSIEAADVLPNCNSRATPPDENRIAGPFSQIDSVTKKQQAVLCHLRRSNIKLAPPESSDVCSTTPSRMDNLM